MSIHKTAESKAAPSFFNNPKNRAIIYQLLLLLGLGYFFYSIMSNTLNNMEARGIKSGFGFLTTTAGFDILMSLIPFDATNSYGRTFVVGLLNSLLVSVIGIFLATLLGFLAGVSRLSHNYLIRKIATIYVELFRNIPLLIQIFFWYFAVLASLPGVRESMSLGEAIFLNVRGLYLPRLVDQPGSTVVYLAIVVAIVAIIFLSRWAKRRQELTGAQFPVFWTNLAILFGLPLLVLFVTGNPFTLEYPQLLGFNFSGGITVIPELMALSVALTFYTGTFIAEAVRAGVQSIPNGQTEAARSIGLQERRIIMLIIIPQALRVIIPQLNSQYQNLIKNSALATAIGYPDLFTVFMGTTLNQTGQAVEIVSMTMLVYLSINLMLSFLMNLLNAKVAIVEKK